MQRQNNINDHHDITTFEYPMSARNRYGINTIISNRHVLAEKSSHQYLGAGAAVFKRATAVKKEEEEKEDFSNAAITDNACSQNTDPFPQHYFENDYTHCNTCVTNNSKESNHALASKNVFQAEKWHVTGAIKKQGDDDTMYSIQDDDDNENVYSSSQMERNRHHNTKNRTR